MTKSTEEISTELGRRWPRLPGWTEEASPRGRDLQWEEAGHSKTEGKKIPGKQNYSKRLCEFRRWPGQTDCEEQETQRQRGGRALSGVSSALLSFADVSGLRPFHPLSRCLLGTHSSLSPPLLPRRGQGCDDHRGHSSVPGTGSISTFEEDTTSAPHTPVVGDLSKTALKAGASQQQGLVYTDTVSRQVLGVPW